MSETLDPPTISPDEPVESALLRTSRITRYDLDLRDRVQVVLTATGTTADLDQLITWMLGSTEILGDGARLADLAAVTRTGPEAAPTWGSDTRAVTDDMIVHAITLAHERRVELGLALTRPTDGSE